MPPDMNITQTRLSEELQLLHFLDPSESRWWNQGAYIANGPRKYEQNMEAKMLDAIALFISGQTPGNSVVAVALDKRHPLTFILAKKGSPPDEADRAHAMHFFECIRTADSYHDILDFVMSTSFVALKERKRKVADADVNGLRQYLHIYEPGPSLKDEFDTAHPFFATFREACEPKGIKSLLTSMVCALQSGLHPDAPCSNNVKTDIKVAIHLAAIFEHSTFLRKAAHYTSGCRTAAMKYQRRLEKLSQYQSGILAILRMRHRYHPPGMEIFHRWIGRSFMGPSPEPVHLCSSPLPIAQRRLDSVTPENLLSLNPEVFKSWANTAQPSIHPEIWLVCYFHMYILDDASQLEFQRRIIGCSKRSCLCCVGWIESHNGLHGLMWETSRVGGKVFRDWAVSGVPRFDDAVAKTVGNYISGRLEPFASDPPSL